MGVEVVVVVVVVKLVKLVKLVELVEWSGGVMVDGDVQLKMHASNPAPNPTHVPHNTHNTHTMHNTQSTIHNTVAHHGQSHAHAIPCCFERAAQTSI